MQAHGIASATAIAAVIVAGALVLLARAPSDDPSLAAPSDEPLTIAINDSPKPNAGAPAPLNDEAAAKVRELEALSETYRNTTFVIAIRDAGYTCDQLLRVYGGIDDSGKWTATCSEMLAYTIGVTGNGTLRVEPFMQYFDGLTPRAIQQFNDDIVPVPPPLQPQELPPRPR